jgi:hypothetical protein
MRMRLGFATALQAHSDVMLLDEILAVGDADFQEKCLRVFSELRRLHKTIVLVTHDLGSVKRFCDRAVLLDQGREVASGDSDRVIAHYLELVGQAPQPDTTVARAPERWGDGRIRFVAGWIEDEEGKRTSRIRSGQQPTVVLRADVMEDTEEPVFGMIILNQAGPIVYVMNTLQLRLSTGTLRAGQTAEIRMPFTAALRNGSYTIHPAVADRTGTIFHDWINRFVQFEVTGSHCRDGQTDLHAGFDCRVVASDHQGGDHGYEAKAARSGRAG